MLSIEEYAQRTGISPRAARLRVSTGKVSARKIGGRWVVEHPGKKVARQPGRRLSANSFDLLAAHLDGADEELTVDERRRARERAARIRSRGIVQVRLYAERPDIAVSRYRASDADLAELRSDPRLSLTGISHPVAEVYGPVLDAYVSPRDRDDIALLHMLEPASQESCNVTLREKDPPSPVRRLHVIADLLDDDDPRSRAEASRLLGLVIGGEA